MSNINDKATVSLFVNGEQAEDAMDRLRKKAEDLDKQLQTAMSAGDKKTANKLQRELDKVNKELNRTESAAKGTGIVLNNLSNTSIHGLRNALKYLEKELRMTKPKNKNRASRVCCRHSLKISLKNNVNNLSYFIFHLIFVEHYGNYHLHTTRYRGTQCHKSITAKGHLGRIDRCPPPSAPSSSVHRTSRTAVDGPKLSKTEREKAQLL